MHAIHKWAVRGDVFVSCAIHGPWLDADYRRWCDALDAAPVRRYLARDLGGFMVSASQRKEAAEILKRKRIALAVMTDSTMFRGVIAAVSWLGVNVKAFRSRDVMRAIDWLHADPALSEDMAALIAACLAEDSQGPSSPNPFA
jgi:hypothetical protein